jgi:superfamily II DNA or RNA helicase
MKTALPLYPYQRQDLDALAAKFREEGKQRVALVLPTGGGKTVCFAHQAMEWLAEHPDDRVLVLVDTDELVWQTRDKIRRAAPHLKVGVVKAGHDEVNADVIVGSVQTLRTPKRRAKVKRVTLIIVDECEMAVTASCMAILEHFGAFGGGTTVAGYTATLMRSDTKSLAAVWQDAVANRDISWMIRNRWLINVRGLAVEVPDLDLRNVKSTRADFREGELGEALAESLAPELVAKAVMEHAADRKVLAFFPTVASAYVFAEAFNDAGIEARVVHGGLPEVERKAVLAWHRRGTVLVNCMILTKGYDDPEIDCIVMGRPTKSKRLYIQIVGRGLRRDLQRPYEEQELLLLDVVGTNAVHDLRSIVDLSDKPIKKSRDGESATLLDLEDEFDAGDGVPEDEPEWYRGDVVVREFDPLGQPSTRVWLKTKAGHFFLPAGKSAYVFIMQWPEPGQWSVAWCGKTRAHAFEVVDGVPKETWPGRQVGMTEHRGLPLDQALVWAGDLAVDMGADLNTADRKAPWRKKVASDKMVSLARGLGLKVDGTTDEESGLFTCTEKAGALSDRITQVMGTRRIDPIVQAVRNR